MTDEPGSPYAITPGDPGSPVILHVPHASRRMTGAPLLVDDAALTEELDHLTDSYTDRIAFLAAADSTVRPWIFENRFSRLVVDPERFPDEREEMLAVGMGAIYTHGYAGRQIRELPVRDATALQTHFTPYAQGIENLVTERLAATGRAVIIDVHSYSTVRLPYELHTGPRPPVCLGTDPFHTPPALLSAAIAAFPETAVNTPFAGCYVPLRYYGTSRAVSALMIEIRRDGYMIEPGGSPTPGLHDLAARLRTLVDAVHAR